MKNYLWLCLLFAASNNFATPEPASVAMVYEKVLYRGAGATIQKLVLNPTVVPQAHFDTIDSIKVTTKDSKQILLSQIVGAIVISLQGYDFSKGIPNQLDSFLKSENLQIIELILDANSLVAPNAYNCKRLIKK